MLRLALRNLSRNLRRLRPMMVVLAFSFFLLFVSNAVLLFIDQSFSSAYVDNLTGHASVSAQAEENFTLFGADALLVGEYIVPPLVADYDSVIRSLSEAEHVSDTTSVVTSVAQLSVDGFSTGRMLFGVNFADYREFFPDLELVHGSFPGPGRPGIVVQQDLYDQMNAATDGAALGAPALLTTAYDTSFTIREVPVTGVFRYPVEDELLSRVVLVDADTARALNGFVYGATDAAELGEQEQALLDASLDDLFADDTSAGGADDPPPQTDDDPFGDLFASPDPLDEADPPEDAPPIDPVDVDPAARQATDPQSDAWNFILLRFRTGSDSARLLDETSFLLDPEQYQVRNWRQTVGGSVLLVWFIRLAVNAGIVFVIFGAAAVAVNAIVLSVLERTKEIGTMRSLGVTRMQVSMLFATETIVVMASSGIIGTLAGLAGVGLVNQIAHIPTNQYLQVLFGGAPIRGVVTPGLLAGHLFGAFAVAIIALAYPLKKALSVAPVRAMQ